MLRMSRDAKLLLAIGTAKDEYEVSLALEEYGDFSQFPIGGMENNCGMIEVMSDPKAAIYERVMNGFDTNIELMQEAKVFGDDIKIPIDAMHAMSRDITITSEEDDDEASETYRGTDPGVFLIHTSTGGKDGIATVTVTVGDTGKGIAGPQFASTILSLANSNKIKNNLLCGRYNMGGSATFNFCDRTVIISRPQNDPRLYFTVVERFHFPDNKNPTYVYYANPDGEIFSCLASELPASKTRFLPDMDNASVKADAYVRVPLPPSHGTVIRHIGYRLGCSPIDMYKQLRQSGFGIPLPVRFMHTTNKNNRYTLTGLRYVLNANKGNKYPVIHTLPRSMGHELIINKRVVGEIGINYWIMKIGTGTSTPVGGRTLSEAHGIFVTANGQTHKQLTTRKLLRNDFPLLDRYIIIEVDCDRINSRERGNLFASNRQDIKNSFEDAIRQKVLQTLKADPRVAEIHHQMRMELRDTEQQLSNTTLVDEINQLLDSPVAGILTSNYGAVSKAGDGGGVAGTGQGGYGGGKYKPQPLVEINDPPTRLSLLDDEIVDDKENGDFIRFLTDAPADYTDQITVTFNPPIVAETTARNSRKLINNGRGGFWIKLLSELPQIDQTVEVAIELQVGKTKLQDCRTYTIIAKPEKRGKQMIKMTRPKFCPHLIKPFDANWVHMHHDADAIAASQIAFQIDYDTSAGEMHIWINETFAPYRHLLDLLLKRKNVQGSALLDHRYTQILCINSLPLIEAENSDMMAELNPTAYHSLKAAFSKTLLVSICSDIMESERIGTLDDEFRTEINLAA